MVLRWRLAQIVFVALGLFVLAGCADAEPERDPLKLEANAVDGGLLYYEDLASQDTVLWFWAPW